MTTEPAPHRLPLPEGWGARLGLGGGRRALLVLLVVLGLASVAATSQDATRVSGLVALVVCGILATAVLLSRPAPSTGTPEVGELEIGGSRVTGLVLPLRRPSRALAAGVTALAVLFIAGTVVTWALLDSSEPEAVFGAVAFGAFAVVFSGAAIGSWAATGRLSYVGLTPTHLVVGQFGEQLELPWADVAEIVPLSVRTRPGPLPEAVGTWVAVRAKSGSAAASGTRIRGPAARVTRMAPAPKGTKTAALVGDVEWAVDPVLAFWTLDFYARHARRRRELAGAEALDRVSRGDVLDRAPD